ncbi:MAG: glutamate 5-kinase [Phycisphaerae bacterium]
MPSSVIREKIVRSAKRLVIKIGTNALTDQKGQLDTRLIGTLATQVWKLKEAGKDIVIVSSGAIGAGIGVLKLPGRPKELSMLQAAAAVGQNKLMQFFEKGFSKYDIPVAQILVTRADFVDRRRYLNIERTLSALNRLNAVPIINENDTVAVDENRFGDNDLIAALVANLIHADLLVILTTVTGLLDEAGNRVDFVPKVEDKTLSLLRQEKSPLGSGGMQSKLQAVKLATNAGIDTIIANGRQPEILTHLILGGKKSGTVFAGSSRKVSGKLRWIASAARTMGKIIVDEGAARMIISGGKSLLPIGITSVEGSFERGDVVAVANLTGQELARGLTNYSTDELLKIKGRRSEDLRKLMGPECLDEAIHRDNLIVTAG